jgi:hypothetical protein
MVGRLMERLDVPEDEPIQMGFVSRGVAQAQGKVEGRNFDIRKHLLEYDDVANDQRKVIYSQRNDLLEVDDIKDTTSIPHRPGPTRLFPGIDPGPGDAGLGGQKFAGQDNAFEGVFVLPVFPWLEPCPIPNRRHSQTHLFLRLQGPVGRVPLNREHVRLSQR